MTLTRSERSLSLGPPSPASCPIRAELLALGRLGGDVREFVRCYLAGSVISNDVLSSTWSQLTNSVVSLLFQSSLLRLFPPKHQYEIATLKRVIAKLECNSSAPPDCLYERLCYAIASPTSSLSTIPGDAGDKSAEVFHRVFVNFEMKDFVVIRENAEQISGGTTGLSCWQAACVLAEFFCCGALAQIAREHGVLSLHLLELGAGCGLTGLALAKFNRHVASLTLTDHNERVLERLHENFRLNAPFSAQIDSGGVRIHALDWQDHDCVDRLSQHKPDVVYAADVVYDPDLITPFCTLLAALLVAKSANSTLSLAFVACTIRNAETLKIFRRELLTQSLRIRQEFIYQPGQKCFIMDDGKSCYCFDEAMFPSASTLLLPVVILEICAA